MRPLRSAGAPFALVVLILLGAAGSGWACNTVDVSAHGWPRAQAVRIEGTLVSIVEDDFAGGRSTRSYMLETAQTAAGNAKRTQLKLNFTKDEPVALRSGTNVAVRGHRDGDELYLTSGIDPASLAVSEAKLASARTSSSNNLRTIAILVDFTNSRGRVSASKVSSLMFDATDSIDDYYRECSFGNLSFSGTVVGPYVTPHPNDGSDGSSQLAWASGVAPQLAADGIDLSQYDLEIYVLAPTTSNWAGAAMIGGRQVFVNGGYQYAKGVYAHEIGHCLTWYHASTPTSEYGDSSCIMGQSTTSLVHPNGPHKIHLGWVPESRVLTVTESGSYSIALLETAAAAPQVLKVIRPNSSMPYYVSFRRRVGYDATYLSSSFADRTSIHLWNWANTYLMGHVGDGQSFEDTANGLTITQTSHDDTFAQIVVSFGGPNQAPVIDSAAWANPNPVTMPSASTVAVVASDPDSGPAELTYTWSMVSGPGSVAFAPNGTSAAASSTATFSAAGNYTMRVSVSDGAAVVASSVTVSVNPDPAVLNEPTNLTAKIANRTVMLAWTDASSNETGFYIERAQKKGKSSPVFERVGQAPANATNFSDAPGNGTFYYRAQAFNGSTGQVSPYSNTTSIRVR